MFFFWWYEERREVWEISFQAPDSGRWICTAIALVHWIQSILYLDKYFVIAFDGHHNHEIRQVIELSIARCSEQ